VEERIDPAMTFQTEFEEWLRDGCEKAEDMCETNDPDLTCGLTDEELTYRFREAVRIENEIKRIKELPISKYDFEKNAPYIEYPDGRRVYAEEYKNNEVET